MNLFEYPPSPIHRPPLPFSNRIPETPSRPLKARGRERGRVGIFLDRALVIRVFQNLNCGGGGVRRRRAAPARHGLNLN